jgi:hydrogenase maturation protein HypF
LSALVFGLGPCTSTPPVQATLPSLPRRGDRAVTLVGGVLRDGMDAQSLRRRIEIQGAVQGVGFRPFVYRIAQIAGVHGYVLNCSAGVVIEAEGDPPAISQFLSALRDESPPLARIDQINIAPATPNGEQGFAIRESLAAEGRFAFVPPDAATCPDCRRELTTPGDRRYRYPFINCTNCGPRYTIIRNIPYDRARTTMAPFQMCAACQAEYVDPTNRRFHAEPNACPDCGPALALLSAEELASGAVPAFHESAEPLPEVLKETRRLLRAGAIVAIKGLGGFHLACAAADDRAVSLLRERKRRSGKAFAIMVKDFAAAQRLCEATEADRALLESPRRPIVLMRRRANTNLSPNLAPGNDSLGVLLPYTPLHHLLFEESPDYHALVMTSGNLSEEPIVSRNEDAWPRLHTLADYFLFHNRDIHTRVDDSVLRTFENREYPVRRSRGFAPDPIDLGMPVHQILACGGELKNTLCLTKDHYAILSPHIGDLENMETMEFFREALAHLKRFFGISPEAVAYDLHPNYLSTRFALEESGLPAIGVQHHHAHIASCMADNGLVSKGAGPVIGVALDGTGYGVDGKIWGGEFLACDFAGFERRGHLRYIPLAGGDAAIRQPWRSALAYLMDSFGPDAASLPLPLMHEVGPRERSFVEKMLARRIQTVETSSCGRLFDAVASILGVRHQTTYEGQAAIELEAVASSASGTYPFALTGDTPFQVDLRASIEAIVEEYRSGTPVADISARFHQTMASVVRDACLRIRESDGLNRVCLSGGTFQNLRLLRHTVDQLRTHRFDVFVHRRVPTNDGGLSLGQAAIANAVFAGPMSR